MLRALKVHDTTNVESNQNVSTRGKTKEWQPSEQNYGTLASEKKNNSVQRCLLGIFIPDISWAGSRGLCLVDCFFHERIKCIYLIIRKYKN